MADEGAGFVPFRWEGSGGVAAVELGEEGCAGEPLPVAYAGFLVIPFIRPGSWSGGSMLGILCRCGWKEDLLASGFVVD